MIRSRPTREAGSVRTSVALRALFLVALVPGTGGWLGACAVSPEPRPVAPDLSAVDRFWPIYDALRADRDPSDEAWEALFATPAWTTLGRFRQEQGRQRYELAFRPSRQDGLDAARAEGGYEATVLGHLLRVTEREGELRRWHGALARGEAVLDMREAALRAASFLPRGVVEAGPTPELALVIHEPDGYADGRVVTDLLYLMEMDDERRRGLLAHELHHVYQSRGIAPFARPRWGSPDQVLLEALFQLQREGTANLVDKWHPDEGVGGSLGTERTAWFRSEMARSREILALMDEALGRMDVADPESALALARDIRWRILPGSGHPTGLHMALTILDGPGRDALVETLANPFDFVRAYNAAAPAGAGRSLGLEAMAILDGVEARTFGAAQGGG